MEKNRFWVHNFCTGVHYPLYTYMYFVCVIVIIVGYPIVMYIIHVLQSVLRYILIDNR